jgi:cytochrome c oxidase cbb3-type subunit III
MFRVPSLLLLTIVCIDILVAQNAPPSNPQSGAPRQVQGGPGRKDDYPERAKAPEDVVRRGQVAYSVSCAFCHGSDAAGGEIGPNLRRSSIVLEDQNGEKIAPIVHGARAEQGMPRIDMTEVQIADIAAYLHALPVLVQGQAPINIVTGDAGSGKQAFDTLCSSCHSVTGDLQGFASHFKDPRTMQQNWLLPGGAGGRVNAEVASALHVPPPIVTVTLPSGQRFEGALLRIDDFYVGLRSSDGSIHGFERNGATPKVDLKDPLAAHRELFSAYSDKQIHDITAYLASLK